LNTDHRFRLARALNQLVTGPILIEQLTSETGADYRREMYSALGS
jgi:hypothetical protein